MHIHFPAKSRTLGERESGGEKSRSSYLCWRADQSRLPLRPPDLVELAAIVGSSRPLPDQVGRKRELAANEGSMPALSSWAVAGCASWWPYRATVAAIVGRASGWPHWATTPPLLSGAWAGGHARPPRHGHHHCMSGGREDRALQ
jgi:hypothetical protein